MYKKQILLGNRNLEIEIGKVAKQAGGSVLIRYGDTVILVTATMSDTPREGIDFFPLLVDYEERLYSVGKIPGGWIKREGKPPESAILAGRAIDRSIRPLFPEGFRHDVQVVITVLSVDNDNPPEILGIIGASVALSISEIPFLGPIGGVRVGRVKGELIINPTTKQLDESEINVVVAGTADAILMVEAGANIVSEAIMIEAIMFAHDHIKKLVEIQKAMMQEIGKPKATPLLFKCDEDTVVKVKEYVLPLIKESLMVSDKKTREENLDEISKQTVEHFLGIHQVTAEMEADFKQKIQSAVQKTLKEEVRRLITEDRERVDGRKLDEIRPISCEVGVLPRTHGSGLFTRGQTQVLTIVTLGMASEEQILDGITQEERKRYIHHYNFPPYSVGEVRPMRGPGRREIGHGALAERALLPVIPREDDFPYTIRLVSEVLESNGSTSQASVCGSSLALMDAGVPIKTHVAGIAMGLVKYGERYAILSDIQGLEDALGDMDFKVAGTSEGITAIQMDIKISGITKEILQEALDQAREGRLFILRKMSEAIAAPRPELSAYAPRMISFEINPDRIRDVIGPGGKMIRKIIEETGVEIDIEDDGRVYIASVDPAAGQKARQIIERLVRDVVVGEVYLGKVMRIMGFGAFVEILPGKEGLVHISQLDKERVAKVEDVVSIGDEIMVKVTDIDRQGRINLSRKAVLNANGPA